MSGRRPQPQAKGPSRPIARSPRRRNSRNQGLIILGLSLATIAVLAVILIVALERSSTVATAAPTPVPTIATAPGVPTIAVPAIVFAPVTKVNHPVAGVGILAPTSGAAKIASSRPQVGQAAPNFAWQTTTGPVDLKGLRGHVVLLDFFAPWCDACQGEETWLTDLLQAYGPSGLDIVGVSSSPYGIHYETQGSEAPISMGDLISYRTTFHVAYPLVFDRNSRVFNLYGSGSSYPTYYLIDAKGIVRFGTSTSVTETTLSQQIQSALAD